MNDATAMKPLRPRAFSHGAAWCLGFLALAAAAAALLANAADRALASATHDNAVALVEQLPALTRAFEPGSGPAQSESDPRLLAALADLTRLTLYDRAGRLLADSRLPGAAAAKVPPWLPDAPDAQGVRRAAAAGLPHSRVLREHFAARLPVYGEAYVPVRRGGQVVGVAVVQTDMSARTRRIRGAFFEAAAVIGGVLLVCAAIVGWFMHQRERERRQVQRQLEFAAAHDGLCALVNRRHFCELLGDAAAGGLAFTLVALDLDHFRDINENHGHAAGDAVIRATADRLRAMVRQGDVVARLGADQFAVLLAGVSELRSVHAFVERALQELAVPIELEGRRIACSASAGAARFGVDAQGVDTLLHAADIALIRAKALARPAFCFYDPALDRQLEARRQLAADLHQALAQGALALHYQPLFDSRSGELVGYEALMRWQHPTRGMVPPGEFIGLAEEIGLIEELGAWALSRACTDASRWDMPLSVSVNLSAAQLHGRADLPDLVARTLEASGLPASRLEIEITESLLMRDTELAQRALAAIADLGVRIALDDFGTGHSSLAYLWRFPIHKVKIDRAFTQGLGDEPKVALIVRSIVSLAHSMGLRVNAEGVETDAQRELLRKFGCDELQGYLLGRPAALPAPTPACLPAPLRADALSAAAT